MADEQAGGFTSLTQRPVTNFITKNVPAPTGLYVGTNDFLRITAQTINNSQPYNVTYRLLRADDGSIVVGSVLFTDPSDGTVQVHTVPLTEGFLLGVSIFPQASGAAFRGTCFVAIQLGTGNPAIPQAVQTLCSDYITNNYGLSWPGGATRGTLDGPGFLEFSGAANPAAGADFAIVLPAAVRWRVLALGAHFNTSAVVASRVPQIVVKQGLTVQYATTTLFAVPASTSFDVEFAPGAPFSTGGAGNAYSVPLPFIVLSNSTANLSIQSRTVNIDAGDQWSSIKLHVEQWIDS